VEALELRLDEVVQSNESVMHDNRELGHLQDDNDDLLGRQAASEAEVRLLDERVAELTRLLEESSAAGVGLEQRLREAVELCAELSLQLRGSEEARDELQQSAQESEERLAAAEEVHRSTVEHLKSDVARLRHQRKQCRCLLRLQKFCIVSQKLLVQKYKEIAPAHRRSSAHDSAASTRQVAALEQSTELLTAKIEESSQQFHAMFSSEMSSYEVTSSSCQGTAHTDALLAHPDDDVVSCSEDKEEHGGEEGELAEQLAGGGHGLAAALRARDEQHLPSTSLLLREADALASSLSHTVGKVQGFNLSHTVGESLQYSSL
jgi:hypothetical protein